MSPLRAAPSGGNRIGALVAGRTVDRPGRRSCTITGCAVSVHAYVEFESGDVKDGDEVLERFALFIVRQAIDLEDVTVKWKTQEGGFLVRRFASGQTLFCRCCPTAIPKLHQLEQRARKVMADQIGIRIGRDE